LPKYVVGVRHIAYINFIINLKILSKLTDRLVSTVLHQSAVILRRTIEQNAIVLTDSEQKHVRDIVRTDDVPAMIVRLAISSNKALMKCSESHGHATRRRPDKTPPPPDVHSSPRPRSGRPASAPAGRPQPRPRRGQSGRLGGF